MSVYQRAADDTAASSACNTPAKHTIDHNMPELARTAFRGFTVDCDCLVNVTVGIPGVISRRIFTLALPTITTILLHVDVSDEKSQALKAL